MNRSTTQTRLPIIKILFKIASTLTLHRSPISSFPLKLRLFLEFPKVISEKYIVKANVFYFEEKSKQNGLLMATFPY